MAFTSPPLRYSQAFLAPKALDLLVIDGPAFSPAVVIGGTKPAAGMLLGVGAQPVTQGGVRIVRGGRVRFVALGGAVLPGDAAGGSGSV